MKPVARYDLRPTSLGRGTGAHGEDFQWPTCSAVGGSGDLEEIHRLDTIIHLEEQSKQITLKHNFHRHFKKSRTRIVRNSPNILLFLRESHLIHSNHTL